MSSTIKEKILLYKVKSGKDADAFGKLYDLYVKRIYRFVFFKVSNHDEAEDITSDVFLKAWNYINNPDVAKKLDSFSGLLYRIARNSIIDLYRSKGNKPEIVSSDEVDQGDRGSWMGDQEDKSESGEIVKALKKLKQEYQEVVSLRYIDELDIDEIAEITGKGKVAVRVTLHRALKKLKQLLDK